MGRVIRMWVVAAAAGVGCDVLDGPAIMCGADAPCPEGAVCRRGFCVEGVVSLPCPDVGDASVGGVCVPAGTEAGLVFGMESLCQEGAWRCDADIGVLVCEGFVGPADRETCNGLDDDCDAVVDEAIDGVDEPCVPDSDGDGAEDFVVTPQNPCIAGRLACVGGLPFCTGSVGPVAEERADGCDGIDDDCDGEIDEAWRVVECYEGAGGVMLDRRQVGVGNCRAGELVCTSEGAVCEGVVLPRMQDFCGNDDEDCDGHVDENGEAPEVCDGEDNDCDGMSDEGLPTTPAMAGEPPCHEDEEGPFDPALAGVGECVAGRSYCQGGRSRCVGAVGPRPELCNELDDSCNGETDEDFDIGGRCVVGIGACAADGALQCDPADGSQMICAGRENPPSPEVCDDINNDCDVGPGGMDLTDESCACNPPAGRQALGDVTMESIDYTLDLMGAESDPDGLRGSCTGAGAGVRDEIALAWTPGPGLRRVEVLSDDFDPMIYLAPLCQELGAPPPDAMSERACVLDSGMRFAEAGAGERAASVVVQVPAGAQALGVYVESQDGSRGGFVASVSDPTGEGTCDKELRVGGVVKGGVDLCKKRLWHALLRRPLPGGTPTFGVIGTADALPAPYHARRWDEPRFCVDNDGRARSVEVDWDDVTDEDGVAAVMLPVGAERGDWWSTVVPADLDWPSVAAAVDPLSAEAEAAPCLANSVRVVAWLSCTTDRAQPMQADNCGAVGNETLVCDPLPPPAPSCVDSDGDGFGDRWTRQLTLSNLADVGCRRAPDSQLVLHVGVIRDDHPAAAQGQCSPCSGVTIPPADCFRYRLRVRRP